MLTSVWLAYGFLITLMGIPFSVAELNAIPITADNYGWRLLLNFPPLTDFGAWFFYVKDVYERLIQAVVVMIDRAMWYHGLLLPVGLAAMALFQTISQRLHYAFWIMVVATSVWYFMLSWTDLKQIIGLMPFFYGGAAVLAAAFSDYLHNQVSKSRWTTYAGVILMGLFILNNLLL